MGVTEDAWYNLGRSFAGTLKLSFEEPRKSEDLWRSFLQGLIDEMEDDE